MINIRIGLATFITALALSGLGHAQAAGSTSAAAAELTDGEVRKIDTDNKKLTIKHGPLKNLDMPGMTMVFQVKDDSMLEKLQVGEKVRFQAEKIDGKIIVTKIEAVR